jgi:NodT family efflux transporter outer membrane factor (OMF) lipoprotein
MPRALLALALTAALAAGTAAAATPTTTLQAPERFAWAPQAAASDAVVEAQFWRRFGDAQLASLVERALHENRDLRAAHAHYEAANALLRGARLVRWPTVRAQAGASDQRLSASDAPGASRAEREGRSYEVGASLSWELDLFGRVRQAVAAQRADTAASGADLRAMQVAIVAEVARTYAELRGLQERLRIAREHAESQAGTLRLVEAGYAAGRGSGFDSARAQAQLASTRARVPALQAQAAVASHRLAVLVGAPPESLLAELASPAPLPALPPAIDAGTPGELLARRPDVAAAQARLAAAGARVGVAHADLFPRFTLGGLIGSRGLDVGSLFQRDAETRVVALGIDWSFLDFGRVRARLAAARADADGELARYEQAMLLALEETENALVRYGHARDEDAELSVAAEASAEAARLARIRFEAGAAGLFEVLDAQREHLRARDELAQARTRSVQDAVQLYAALAGGWPDGGPQVVATAR